VVGWGLDCGDYPEVYFILNQDNRVVRATATTFVVRGASKRTERYSVWCKDVVVDEG
jgi:hypothetical protein